MLMGQDTGVVRSHPEFYQVYFFQLCEIFEQEIDPVMQSLGYCCGRKCTYSPQTLCCYGQQNTICTIPRDAKFYVYENK